MRAPGSIVVRGSCALLLLALAVLAPAAAAVVSPVVAPAVEPAARVADPPAAPDISVELSPDRPEVGLVMSLVVTVSGSEGADCDLLDLPEVDGARLHFRGGPRTQRYQAFDSRTGRLTNSVATSWQFELVPELAGELVVPPFRFNCRGTELETDVQRVRVAPSSLISDDLVTLEIKPSTDELWVGQILELEVVAMIKPEAEDVIPRGGIELELPWISGTPGLHPRDIPHPNCRSVFPMPVNGGAAEVPLCQTREIVGGGSRLVFRTTVPMMATQAGTLTLPDARFSARLVIESRRERDSLFPGLFGRGTVVPTRVLVTDATASGPAVTVRPTPLDGRPPSYTNAVGRFVFGGAARPTSLSVGESCTLTLTLRNDGTGPSNLDLVEWPAYEQELDDFRLFGKDSDKGAGARVLEFELSPKDARVTEIPALTFSFFDTEAGRYETRTVGPFPLDVTPGGDGGLTELAAPEEVLNDLESIRTELPGPRGDGLPAWLAPGVALLVLLAVETTTRRRRWREAHPEKVVRKGARGTLEKALAAADGPAEAGSAFSRYLASRLDGPPGGLTAEEAAERLRARDAALADRLVATVGGWEAAYLGGATVDLNALRAEARALADAVEAAT